MKLNLRHWWSVFFSIFGIFIITILSLPDKTYRKAGQLLCTQQRPACLDLWKQMGDYNARSIAHRQAALQQEYDSEAKVIDKLNAYDPFEQTWNCYFEQRIGREFGDGGKFVCGLDGYFRSLPSCLVYSIGSDGDFSFEEAVKSNFGCEIHTFDPTGDTPILQTLASRRGIEFHAIGLGQGEGEMKNANNVTHPVLPLYKMMKLVGHTGRKLDILKVDCEGCEHAAFEAIYDAVLAKELVIGQILVEMHGADIRLNTAFFERTNSANYYIFHKERNHWGCQGYACVEFSLIHNSTAWDIHRSSYCET